MNVKEMAKAPEGAFAGVDPKGLAAKADDVYQALYMLDMCTDPGALPSYWEAVEAFDEFAYGPNVGLLRDCARARGDAFSSDREAASFMLALLSLAEFQKEAA